MAVEKDEETLDDKTIKCLDDVKKGKPRKFAMICKGAKIVSLVVYKKGSLDKYKKEAKEQGKGVFYHGVIDGKGVNFNFKLARADGFDKVPGPTTGLKSFLAEQADLKVMPVYEIVDEIGPVLDPDDPLAARFLKLQAAALAACDAHANKANEINGLCLEIGSLLDQEDQTAAEGKIGALESLLSSLSTQADPSAEGVASPPPAASPPAPPSAEPQSTTPPPPPPPAPKVPDRMPEFMERLKELKPQFDEAKASSTSLSKEAQTQVAEAAALAKQAGGLAQKKDFDKAFELVEQAAGLLASSLKGKSDGEAQCAELKKVVYPQVKPAVVANPAMKGQFVALLNEAAKLEKSGAFPEAMVAYQQLEALVKQAMASETKSDGDASGGVSVFKLGKARVEWQTTRLDAIKAMDKLKVAFEAAYASKPQLKSEVAAALQRLDGVFTTLHEELYEQLDKLLNEADPPKRAALAGVARKTMSDFIRYVESDNIMQNLDGNEILPETQITAPIYVKLREIAAALG